MPTYVFRCPKCTDTIEKYMSIAQFDERDISHCGVPRETVIQPVQGYVQMECRYKSLVTGREITSWADRRDEFARENLVDVSDMPQDWKKDIGKPPKWARPITNKKGKVISDPMVGTFAKKGTDAITDTDLTI